MINLLILLIDEMTCVYLKFVYDTKDEFTWKDNESYPARFLHINKNQEK